MVKNNVIFLCLGDKEVFGSYVVKNLLDEFDLVINYFGVDTTKISYFKKYSKYFQHKKGTKFLALKDIVDHNPNLFDKYNYMVLWDDDAIIERGSINQLIELMSTYNLKIISPSHSINGKISHNLMRTYPGNHLMRLTNFIEMNFPIFKMSFIMSYINQYDGSCCGYGNDWWYMNLIEDRGSKYDVAICDGVIVKNPRNNFNKDNISTYTSKLIRHEEWQQAKIKYDLDIWPHKTLAYIHDIDNQIILTPTTLMP